MQISSTNPLVARIFHRPVVCIYVFCYAFYMDDPTIKARVKRVDELCRQHEVSQTQIAQALGASQSQVSRILKGHGLRQSRLLEEVCLYVERLAGAGVSAAAVRANHELVNALQDTWDGSSTHAKALSTVIRTLSLLHAPPAQHKNKAR